MEICLFTSFVFIFSIVCYFILLKFSTNLGVRKKHEGQVRFSTDQKPALGGIVFYVAFILSAMAYSVLDNQVEISRFVLIVIAVTFSFLIGLADDAYNTNPLLKFTGQLICSILLILAGVYVRIFEVDILNYFVTSIWVIGIMNSINMLDNMDGTATITGLTIAIITYLFGWVLGYEEFLLYVNIGLIAVLTAFLFFNWHPSKLYMGDSGSMTLGILLAILGIAMFWNPIDINDETMIPKRILVVIAVFIVPIADTTSVVINRIRKGTSPFVGGKDHTTHHLSYLGVPVPMVPLVLLILSILGGLLAILIAIEKNWTILRIVLYSFTLLAMLIGIYSFTRIKKIHKLKK